MIHTQLKNINTGGYFYILKKISTIDTKFGYTSTIVPNIGLACIFRHSCVLLENIFKFNAPMNV